MKKVVIIGNGISGITAARHLRKLSDCQVSVISSESKYFFSRTALMYVYMGHMKFEHTQPYEQSFWKKNRIDLIEDHVTHVDSTTKKIKLKSGNSISFTDLIIATGSKPAYYQWPGEQSAGVQGLYSYQDLKLMEENTRHVKRAVIVGGGLIGVEMAEMLRSRNIEVTFLVRENEFWSNVLPTQEAAMISNHLRDHHIDLRLSTELKEILNDTMGRVRAVRTSNSEEIDCQFVGITAGVTPNIEFLKGSEVEISRGILVNEFLETNCKDIYAIGDCAERKAPLPGRRAIEQVWYTGRMMGETVAHTICGNKTKYEPGPWFNSAKFFDIEYQTYGWVGNKLKPDESEFYWEHSKGNKCMHLVWDKQTEIFLGINSFGIRLRHECFDRWLREKRTISFIMQHLEEANFDPEFFPRHEKEIRSEFIKLYPQFNLKVS